MKSFALALSFLAAMAYAVVELASTSAIAAGSIDARVEIAAAIYAASATQLAAEKSADTHMRAQQTQIASLETKIHAGEARHKEELAAAEEQFVADLQEKDRAYAEAIAVFRSAVTDIASTPDGVKALSLFNGGDETGALQILDRINQANEEARQKRSNIENAAEKRRIAQLALEANNRGKVSVASVAARYEEVLRLDPGVFADWAELDRLYQLSGRLPDARKAAEGAALHAITDRDRSVALSDLGDILVAQGDLANARKAYQEDNAICRHLSNADPNNADLLRNVAVSLEKIGEVQVAQGDLAGAHKTYDESLGIARKLAMLYPSDANLQRDVPSNLDRYGDALLAQGDQTGARNAYEEAVAIFRKLAAADPTNATLKRDISVTLERIANVLVAQNDLVDARKDYEEERAILTGLTNVDPTNTSLQRDLAVSMEKIADLLTAQSDFAGALAIYTDTLAIRRRLWSGNPSNAYLQRDITVSLEKTGDALKAQGDIAGARRNYDADLEITRRMAVADPSNAILQRDLSVAIERVGDLIKAQGDVDGARKAYEETLRIRRRLVVIDPSNAGYQRDLWVSLWRFAQFPNSGISWADVLAEMERSQRNGTLRQADVTYLEQARANAGKATTP